MKDLELELIEETIRVKTKKVYKYNENIFITIFEEDGRLYSYNITAKLDKHPNAPVELKFIDDDFYNDIKKYKLSSNKIKFVSIDTLNDMLELLNKNKYIFYLKNLYYVFDHDQKLIPTINSYFNYNSILSEYDISEDCFKILLNHDWIVDKQQILNNIKYPFSEPIDILCPKEYIQERYNKFHSAPYWYNDVYNFFTYNNLTMDNDPLNIYSFAK